MINKSKPSNNCIGNYRLFFHDFSKWVFIPPAQRSCWGGVYWFHSVRPSDILLYKICYNIQWIYFTIWEKGKEELSPLQYHFKSLHIISRHYKKSLLRSQIYHGYEELSTDTNYPIWRRQITLYEEDKKEEASMRCSLLHGSWDQILRRRPSVPHAVSALYHLQLWMDSFRIRHKWSLPWEGVSRTMTFDLDLYLQGRSALT